jgi:hypothetical protein
MTDQPNTAVTLERLAQLLDAYGGEPARWPEHERSAALQLIASSPEAQSMQRTALELDGILDLDQLPEVESSPLRARVLEIPIRHPREERAAGWGLKWNWMLGLFALTPCVIGFLSGTMLMDPSADADDEAWEELAQVMMPVTLSDELDMFDGAEQVSWDEESP